MKHNVFLKNHLKFIVCILMLAALVLLNGCSSVSRKDGPPPFPVDVSKIPDAVPKKEALSKYGNYPSYVVFGRRYYTLKTSKNYEAQGVASWYGTKFHSLRTSSGERYNMLGMTAAHKTLPLPTYVQVTNLANNKQVIVKVNDRGPFESNRLIDLSYVAAKKLGITGRGTAYVDVKAIDPDAYYRHILTEKPTILAHNTHYSRHHHHSVHDAKGMYLQVGAFKNRVYAERLKNRLSKVVSSPIRVARISNHLYHVQIGPIRDVATATQISERLRSIGLSSTKKMEA